MKFSPTKKRFFKVNVQGTRNILKIAESEAPNLKRFVLFSSLAASGPSKDGKEKTEEDPDEPVSFYGESKLLSEMVLKEEFDGLPYTILRPPVVYGPGDRDLLTLFSMAKRGVFLTIKGGGKVDMCHVKDLSALSINAMKKKEALGQTFFVKGEKAYDWIEIKDILSKIFRRNIREITAPLALLRFLSAIGDILLILGSGNPRMITSDKLREIKERFWLCSDKKARELLGYRPSFTLESGFSDTVSWYRKEGWL